MSRFDSCYDGYGLKEKTQLFWEQKPKQMWKNMNRKVQVNLKVQETESQRRDERTKSVLFWMQVTTKKRLRVQSSRPWE
ncbi:unnamed protein product, partial [Symbiodinium pilosum]